MKVAHRLRNKQKFGYLANWFLLAALVPWLFAGCHRQVYIQTSVAMEPTIKAGERVTGDTAAYKHTTPTRWDVIIFRFPEDRNTLAMMRVVGLPGETIKVEENGIVLNGKSLEPPPTLQGITYSAITSALAKSEVRYPLAIPEKSYFVLGDNSSHARDSRFWGVLSSNQIVGKVLGR